MSKYRVHYVCVWAVSQHRYALCSRSNSFFSLLSLHDRAMFLLRRHRDRSMSHLADSSSSGDRNHRRYWHVVDVRRTRFLQDHCTASEPGTAARDHINDDADAHDISLARARVCV